MLSGNLEVTQAIPKEELEKYWASIFSRKPEGIVKIDTVNPPSDTSTSLKDNFPGPDGLKKSDVVKISIQILHPMLLLFHWEM